MKRVTKILWYELILLIGFSGAVAGTGQNGKLRTAQPKLNDSRFERWIEFKSKEGNFSILFPDAPETHSPDDEPTGPLPMYSATYQSTIHYTAMCIDYPENLEAPIVAKDVLDKARDSGLIGSAEALEHPKLISEREVSFEGHPARELRINMSGGRVALCKFIIIKNHFYLLEVVLPKPTPPSRRTIDYEKIARFFLDSFRTIQETA